VAAPSSRATPPHRPGRRQRRLPGWLSPSREGRPARVGRIEASGAGRLGQIEWAGRKKKYQIYCFFIIRDK